jgi:hypothetical protein
MPADGTLAGFLLWFSFPLVGAAIVLALIILTKHTN